MDEDVSGIEYGRITAELSFTDGERNMIDFTELEDCLLYVKKMALENYVDSVRIVLF